MRLLLLLSVFFSLVLVLLLRPTQAFSAHSSRSQRPVGILSALPSEGDAPVMVSPESAHSAIEKGEALLLDVREFGEMAYSGACGVEHEHVSVMRWEHGMWLPRPEFVAKALSMIDGQDESKEVLVLSRDGGGRTKAALELLAGAGRPAKGIAGGWMAWEEAELPQDEDMGY